MSEKEKKYIELLLKKCINFDKSKSLFINYDTVNKDFVNKLVNYAEEIGIENIYLDEKNIQDEYKILKNISIEDIENHPYFDDSMWDEYAKKDASFLIFTSPIPNIMDDIDPKKLSEAQITRRKSRPIYTKKQNYFEVPWCIAALPNDTWAKSIYQDEENAYELLENAIYKMCMIDTENPILSWDMHLENNKRIINKLNNLKLKLLHYKNSLGTDLKIELLDDGIWCDASMNGLVNMPSYEVFTSPNYKKTNGIVYGSRPLVYNGGLIDKFWIKFKDGKVIDCGADIGEEILRSIINNDANSCYLGECAIVEDNSPISNMNVIFNETLFDENAACHLALGDGFPECIKDGDKLSANELHEKGINISNTHVDFMIGTSDLNIEAETDEGKILIFKDGNFNI